QSRLSAEAAAVETAPVRSPVAVMLPDVLQAPPEPEKTTELKPAPAARKSLFWSAAVQNPASAARSAEAAPELSVPPMLRNLRKCQACGFPVSQGRAFCVECEERQWRGQRLPHAEVKARQDETKSPGDPDKDGKRNTSTNKEKNNDGKAKAQAAPPVPKASAVAVAEAVTEPVTEKQTEKLTQATFIQDSLPDPV